MNMTPEQIEQFWTWCGWGPHPPKDYDESHDEAWIYYINPDGKPQNLPDIHDLNALLKWVPGQLLTLGSAYECSNDESGDCTFTFKPYTSLKVHGVYPPMGSAKQESLATAIIEATRSLWKKKT